MNKRQFHYRHLVERGDIIIVYKRGEFIGRIGWYFLKYRDKGYIESLIKDRSRIIHACIYLGDGLIAEVRYGKMRIEAGRAYNRKSYRLYIGKPKDVLDHSLLMKLIRNKEASDFSTFRGWRWNISLAWGLLSGPRMVHSADSTDLCAFYVDTLREMGIDLAPGIYEHDAIPLDILASERIETVVL
jgi:hypothetical protein